MAQNTPITVAHGDGIGPEIMKATLKVLLAAGAKLDIHEVEIGEKVYLSGHPTGIEDSTWDTIRNTQAFLKAPITTTEDDIAMRNLAVEELKQRAAGMGYSPEEIQDFVIKAKNADIYNYGRYNGYANGQSAILGSLTNPFAWAQFFDALKKGDFSSKKK